MDSKKLNLFIVDDDKSMVAALKQYLNKKFGNAINISAFYDGDSCLKNINDQTHVVLLDYFLNGKNGVQILKEIKSLNPKTEVIMLSSHEDIATAIESLQKGAIDYIVKGKNSWQKLYFVMNKIITTPVSIFIKKYRIFMIVLILSIIITAAIVMLILRIIS